jgi:hypothetical protein
MLKILCCNETIQALRLSFLLDKRKTLLEMECSLKRNWLRFVLGLNVKFLGSLAQEIGVSSLLSPKRSFSIRM